MANNTRTLNYHLNRVAGLLVNGQPTSDEAYAANVYAGTTSKKFEVVGALNAKAGRTDPKTFLELAGILNLLAGTTGLGVDEAASRLP
jgi:hypothetical protein